MLNNSACRTPQQLLGSGISLATRPGNHQSNATHNESFYWVLRHRQGQEYRGKPFEFVPSILKDERRVLAHEDEVSPDQGWEWADMCSGRKIRENKNVVGY
jgi:hypothetical protein